MVEGRDWKKDKIVSFFGQIVQQASCVSNVSCISIVPILGRGVIKRTLEKALSFAEKPIYIIFIKASSFESDLDFAFHGNTRWVSPGI